ncbi:MAG: C40 family peptidase [Phaeodactylibacter sp.]|nr:C40 family peptidase [Phaeodactylibacter sp.]MCB0616750.1 C40 family peptidase [Phaeodactylibacter sp.]MCB9301978.1 C40 family peptidase [Lewinellaceae bacterium]HQU57965.1 C40 family peptidase [Saprospiraceae bacterium]
MLKSILKTASLVAFLAFSFSRCALFTPVEGPRQPHNPSRAGGGATTVVDESTRKRKEVVDFAKGYLGTPYRAAGKDPRGFDCSGFTGYVMKNFGVTLSGSSKYQAKEGRKVNIKEVKPGDLIFFRRSPAGEVFHVALVVRNSRDGIEVIHSASRGVVIENISESDYWRPKISSARDVLQ